MSYHHPIYYSYQPVPRKAPETLESQLHKSVHGLIEKWVNTIDDMSIL
jgi:hypothetical protein